MLELLLESHAEAQGHGVDGRDGSLAPPDDALRLEGRHRVAQLLARAAEARGQLELSGQRGAAVGGLAHEAQQLVLHAQRGAIAMGRGQRERGGHRDPSVSAAKPRVARPKAAGVAVRVMRGWRISSMTISTT